VNFYLLKLLTEKELKARYRGSVLGFFWSFLNPLLYMAVLTVIFSFIVRIKIENYPLFILSGLLPWIFVSSALSQSTNSIVANASLINKVYLPKELFPFSLILANAVNFLFSTLILLVLLVIFGIKLNIPVLIIFLPFVILMTTAFCAGICLLFSCLNVFLRDLTHLVSIILTFWFYASPVFYPVDMVPKKYLSLYALNPMVPIIHIYREILLYGRVPQLKYILLGISIPILFVILGYSIFRKYEHLFPELI